MQKPFVFGVPVDDEHFIGREIEQERLRANFQHGINTILLSPRRWGKTSLVKKIAQEVSSKRLIVVYVDAFSCRNEYDFYNRLASDVLRQTSSQIEEWKEQAKGFIERLTPKISISADPASAYSVSLGITPKTHTPQEILNLPEQIASRKKCQIVICIDEFQQIGEFSESLSIQRTMRSVWQHHKNVSYCLFGSKMHMMIEMFQKKSFPFFKFGDILYLDNIPTETWIPYIRTQFQKEQKDISPSYAEKICHLVNNHSSYVQQLAWLTLLNTKTETTECAFQTAVMELVEQNAAIFTQQTESLTTYQMNFLRALIDDVTKDFGLESIRETYQLGSTSNIVRLKRSLQEKELIEITDKGIFLADPVLKLWLKKLFSNG